MTNAQQDPSYDAEYDYSEFLNDPRFSEGFNLIPSGDQGNGIVIVHLGYASQYILEELGVEGFVSESGFNSSEEFYCWVKSTTGMSLTEWEPVEATLFHTLYRPEADQKEYWAWRSRADSAAIESRKKVVYAIRHKGFHDHHDEHAGFLVARMISYAKDIWELKNGSAPFIPQSMDGYLDYGYHLTGSHAESTAEVILTWPTTDLIGLLGEIDSFAAKGFTNIHLWEGDIGLSRDAMNVLDKTYLVRAFNNHGADCPLMDLISISNSYKKQQG